MDADQAKSKKFSDTIGWGLIKCKIKKISYTPSTVQIRSKTWTKMIADLACQKKFSKNTKQNFLYYLFILS